MEPTSGLKDSGWTAAQRPAAKHVNWLFNLIYQWIQYLDGLLAEALTWTGLQTFNGGATFNATVTNPITLGGTGRINGEANFFGDVNCQGAGGLDVTNDIGAGGDVTATNIVANADLFHTTPHPVTISATAGWDLGSDWSRASGLVSSNTATPSAWVVPIPVEAGWTVDVTARVAHGSASAGALRAVLRRTSSGAAATVVAGVDSAATTGPQTIAVVTGHDVVAGDQYWLTFTDNSGAGAMTRAVYEVHVNYVKLP